MSPLAQKILAAAAAAKADGRHWIYVHQLWSHQATVVAGGARFDGQDAVQALEELRERELITEPLPVPPDVRMQVHVLTARGEKRGRELRAPDVTG